jgi:hypothetical protein
MALNTVIIKIFMVSTREMPDIACSPTELTITMLITPVITIKSCSTINGQNRVKRRLLFQSTGVRVMGVSETAVETGFMFKKFP